jgi:hypothetical protein
MALRPLIAPITIILMISSGCGSGADLTRSKVKTLLEAKPVNVGFDSWVQLSKEQFECGLKAGLWDQPQNGYRAGSVVTRVTDKGEALKFRGMVQDPGPNETTRDAGARIINVVGEVAVTVDEVTGILVQLDQGAKWAKVKLGAKFQHACFASPLPFVTFIGEGLKQAPGPVNIGFVQDDTGWHLGGVPWQRPPHQ